MKNLCITCGVVDVDIEVQENTAQQLLPYEATTPMMEDLPTSFSKIGSSFGPVCDELLAGTLGGYVSIDGPNRGRYALTCDHVALPNIRPSPSGFAKAYRGDSAKNDLVMHQPCKADLARITDDLERQQIGYQSRVDKLCAKKIRAREGIDSFPTIAQRNLDQNLDALQSVSNQLAAGFHGFRMVWSLVDISPGRFERNRRLAANELTECRLSRLIFEEFNKDLPESLHIDNLSDVWPMTLSKIRTVSDIKQAIADEDHSLLRVLKRGRTTGWTAGRINEFVHSVIRDDGLITTELAVVNLFHGSDYFCRGGDSGSLVFDRFGGVVGMIHTAIGYEIALLTPIEVLFEDIKKATGATRVQLDHF